VKLLIKLGGTLLDSEDSRYRLALEITGIAARGHQVVLVHGGGKQLSRYLTERGVESRFVNGFRVTTPETLDAVVKVLAGEVNLTLVTALQQAGGRAVGLTGADAGLVQAVRLSAELGAVGRVERVRPEVLELLTSNGYLPVVACLAGGDHGAVYNVNADQMAVACASYFMADRLIFLTDVTGVLDANKSLIAELSPAQAQRLIDEQVATGGMEAKLRACLSAVRQGVPEVRIAPGAVPRVLERVLAGEPIGTAVAAAARPDHSTSA
jgi:acetylglutamate kinase